MKQADLYRAVAKATGETVALIEHMGFQHVVTPVPVQRSHRRRRRRRRWIKPMPARLTA